LFSSLSQYGGLSHLTLTWQGEQIDAESGAIVNATT